jgi:glycosyltransferase involved in cell wall biosynthesis
LLSYRRIDLAVDAAKRLNRELVIAGDGPERARLQGAAGPGTRFVGHVDRPALVDLFARCHAYLVPGEEDFGIAPVEAMASGKPVVALRAGGVLDTVIDGETGVLFGAQTSDSLAEAIERVDRTAFDRSRLRAHAETFGVDVFRRRFSELLLRLGLDSDVFRESRPS